MGLFDFFKREQKPQEEIVEDKYWSLTTYESETTEPNWKQIEMAVKKAIPEETVFATLAYNHSGLEIESIQTIGDDAGYRFEALTSDGRMFINDGLSYEETLKFFEDFFKYQRVAGFRSWPIEKY